jgi:hypothetical protein
VTYQDSDTFISAVALWCGFGLRRRSETALKGFIVLLACYVLWTVGLAALVSYE